MTQYANRNKTYCSGPLVWFFTNNLFMCTDQMRSRYVGCCSRSSSKESKKKAFGKSRNAIFLDQVVNKHQRMGAQQRRDSRNRTKCYCCVNMYSRSWNLSKKKTHVLRHHQIRTGNDIRMLHSPLTSSIIHCWSSKLFPQLRVLETQVRVLIVDELVFY